MQKEKMQKKAGGNPTVGCRYFLGKYLNFFEKSGDKGTPLFQVL